MNKLGELHELLYDGATADCFCITESWLHDEISNGMLDPKSMFSIGLIGPLAEAVACVF